MTDVKEEVSQSWLGGMLKIIPRRMSFSFNRVTEKRFFKENAILSAFGAALSATFPPGEQEFIQSVRLYRDKVTDPHLKEQIRGFISQEGHHSHQHKQANEALRDIGLDAVRLEKHLERDIKKFHKHKFATNKRRLAITVGMEHITAILAEHLLRHPEILEGVDDSVQDLFYWHAVEEIEHKAVAFDVYMQCIGDQKFLHRSLKFVNASFMIRIVFYIAALLWWSRSWPTWAEWKQAYGFFFGEKGLISCVREPYRDYFKMGFHPWDHANQDLVDKWKNELHNPENERASRKKAINTQDAQPAV